MCVSAKARLSRRARWCRRTPSSRPAASFSACPRAWRESSLTRTARLLTCTRPTISNTRRAISPGRERTSCDDGGEGRPTARPARVRTIAPPRGSIVTKALSAIRSVKGTRDLLPSETPLWQRVEEEARRVFDAYNFREIRTPVLERTDLFARSVGADTDIVTKEMYTFQDRDEESLTLRPEATASVVRAYIEHRLFNEGGVHKLYYLGPMFRRERPQKGRYRQFYQIGAEVLGSSDAPGIDAEVIEMLLAFFERLKLKGAVLHINSIGDKNCRPAYVERLRAELQVVREKLGADSQRRIETNPLRVLDSKLEHEQAIIERLPRISDHLCAACREHFAELQAQLKLRSIEYKINWRLVRGLDYYTRTTFEITAPGLGSQNAICGGGRYDGLVELLGGPPTKGIGFAIGTDRLVLALQEAGK